MLLDINLKIRNEIFRSDFFLQYDVPTETSVREGEPVGTLVYTAVACDLDNPPYNTVQYSFYENSTLYCKFRLCFSWLYLITNT